MFLQDSNESMKRSLKFTEEVTITVVTGEASTNVGDDHFRAVDDLPGRVHFGEHTKGEFLRSDFPQWD